jgi:hypothetical protein
MKVTAYVRVARTRTGKPTVDAGPRPTDEPLKDQHGKALPTVAFALKLDVPEERLRAAEQVLAEIEVSSDEAEIVVGVQP